MVSTDLLKPNPSQPRKQFEQSALEELAESIKENGVIQPLIVRKENGGFEIVAGERRWRAAKIAKLEKLPVIIRTATDQDVAELTLIENIQREDLNPIEEGEAYEKLAERFGLTHEEIAKKTGKTRSVITNQLRLLKLSEKAKKALVSGSITVGHARALLAASSPGQMDSLLGEVLKKDLTVRRTEALVKKKNRSAQPPPEFTSGVVEEDIFTKELTEELSGKFSTKVRISRNKTKGKIEIEYYSPEELERIVGILLSRG
ncbi:MAG: ParB/RepB/Spo0J family partition protein [Candidatus Dadabacteria bacterium]|nr:ParB/RepB/Spo0J family partition protein [Candidatus Dadabacteria bacterium]MYA48196.1 ParB/RepB/Spo0J family partition protein [Candidatus Dadabacteria bacterium]MYG83415.1 ParB/RepB/Spo0J family partition protein [Candidatus Dadabacteria bacterium]MYK49551.1 ParB/RepB/Spo0J family partition protein [Candidatus Dadabacteria bacterium]